MIARSATALLALALAGCGGGNDRSHGEGAFGNRRDRAERNETSEPAAKKPTSAPAPAAAAPPRAGVTADGEPTQGSAQRAAIMDALRPAIERKLAGPVEFVVQRVAVQDGWALVIAEPQRPGGGRIDAADHFPADQAEFMDGVTVNGVLRFSGEGWTLVDHAIGPTDVWYCGMEGPPRSLTGC